MLLGQRPCQMWGACCPSTAGALHSRIPSATLDRMVAFLQRLHHDANVTRRCGSQLGVGSSSCGATSSWTLKWAKCGMKSDHRQKVSQTDSGGRGTSLVGGFQVACTASATCCRSSLQGCQSSSTLLHPDVAVPFSLLCSFASAGGPWEFNLRDLLRWCELAESSVVGG